MRRSGIAVKTISLLLLIGLQVVSVAGCTKKADPEAELTEFTEEFVDTFFDKPKASIKYNSDKDLEFPELTDEQTELLEYACSGTSVKVDEVSIDDDNDEKGTVKITFSGYKAYSDDLAKIATMDEYKAIVDDIKTDKVTLKLKAVKVNDEWMFRDLGELEEMFFEPYGELCFLDESGNPINITPAYEEYVAGLYSDHYVGSYWYDIEMGNPLTVNSVPFAPALQNVFYFDQPISGEFTAELSDSNGVVASIDLAIDESVVITCDFPNPNGFPSGTYTVTLMTGSVKIAVSPAIIVN